VWTLQTAVGGTIVEGGDSGSAIPPRRPYDYFMAVFPPYQLVRMVELTNKKLADNKNPQLTTLVTGRTCGGSKRGAAFFRRGHLAQRLGCRGSGSTILVVVDL
jgi:hypothetical protein